MADRARRARLPCSSGPRRAVGRRGDRPGDVTTLPRALAATLDEAFRWSTVADDALVLADGGQTEKALHRLSDGSTIESVLMHYPARAGREGAAHAVHLEPGRLRRRVPVLRDWRARVRARPRDRGDPGPGPAAPSGGSGPRGRRAPDEHRVHGHGRATAQPGPRARGRRRAQRPGRARPRRAPHHGLDLRRRAGHPAADRARAPVHARDQHPRRARCAARRARPAQPSLAGGGGRRGRTRPRSRDGPARELRSDDDRRRERHRSRRGRARGSPARRPRARQPDPDEPGRPHAVVRQPDARDRGVRRPAPGGRHPGHDSAQPRPGDRCRVRPACRRARWGAGSTGRGLAARRLEAESARALRGERSDEPVPAGVI